MNTARSNAPRMDSQRNTINDYPPSFNLYPVLMKKKIPILRPEQFPSPETVRKTEDGGAINN